MAKRTDELGRAYKQSQLQTQLYANRREGALTAAVVATLPTLAALQPRLVWVSPLEGQKFAEYHDRDFLAALGREDLVSALAEYWPSGGPHWDALAVARDSGGEYLGAVLVEAKSWPGEMRSRFAGTHPDSRRRILARLAETRAWLGIGEAYAPAWQDRYYQSANRFAHLRFFTELLGERAWLANVYFLDDPDKPTTRAAWKTALDDAERELGLAGVTVPNSGRIFLPAGERAELLAPHGDAD